MDDVTLKNFKLGQQQGTQDFFEGPHKRWRSGQCDFSDGYVQGYDLAESETDHETRNGH